MSQFLLVTVNEHDGTGAGEPVLVVHFCVPGLGSPAALNGGGNCFNRAAGHRSQVLCVNIKTDGNSILVVIPQPLVSTEGRGSFRQDGVDPAMDDPVRLLELVGDRDGYDGLVGGD